MYNLFLALKSQELNLFAIQKPGTVICFKLEKKRLFETKKKDLGVNERCFGKV